MAICDSFKKYTLYPALFYPDACGFSLAAKLTVSRDAGATCGLIDATARRNRGFLN